MSNEKEFKNNENLNKNTEEIIMNKFVKVDVEGMLEEYLENKNIKVSKVKVINLFDAYDYDITFNKDVNLILGGPGMGKSTLLKMIYYILDRKIDLFHFIPFEEFHITLVDEDNIPTNLKVIKYNEKPYLDFYFNEFKIMDEYPYYTKYIEKGKKVVAQDDIFITPLIKSMSNDHLNHPFYGTKHRGRCTEIINKLLPYGKNIEWKGLSSCGQYLAKMKDFNNNEIYFPNFSESEKRLLTMFYECAQAGKYGPNILILDNPENSINIKMQKELVKNMLKINDKVQLIFATNSPFISGEEDEYIDKMIEFTPIRDRIEERENAIIKNKEEIKKEARKYLNESQFTDYKVDAILEAIRRTSIELSSKEYYSDEYKVKFIDRIKECLSEDMVEILKLDFNKEQIHEIIQGIKYNLSIEKIKKYAKLYYDAEQMGKIQVILAYNNESDIELLEELFLYDIPKASLIAYGLRNGVNIETAKTWINKNLTLEEIEKLSDNIIKFKSLAGPQLSKIRLYN